MVEHRGVVLHIADGWFDGTISWQQDPQSRVSSHFIIGRARGQLVQMVDTDVAAWTQSAGNGRWLSIEFVGFHKGHRLNPGGWERLTDWQVEAAARILAKAHQVYGIPLQQTNSTSIGGLGYHSMGGAAWGNHPLCPGPDIIAARGRIITQAKKITKGETMAPRDLWKFRGYDYVNSDKPTTKDHQLARVHERTYELRGLARKQQEMLQAILTAVTGSDTAAVLKRLDQHHTEQMAELERQSAALEAAAQERAKLRELVEQWQSGDLTAEQVVDALSRRLASAGDEDAGE